MNRFKSAILGAAISGICVFTIGAAYASREKKSEDSDFIWLGETDLSDELLPLFDEGDFVYITNSSDYWGGVYNPMEPVLYEVKASRFDQDDETYRYKLHTTMHDDASFSDKWVAEEWLDYATKPRLTKELPTVTVDVDAFEKIIVRDVEQKLTAEIDYWLDTLRYSTDERERLQAEERLTELAENRRELTQIRKEG
ncbi:hypothetical protein [Oceanobacillus sojae]|uniref:hypothetical protein n=1 Tax=Oceanobacillus sojae TaxID=582851 RepID=UPI0036361E83